MKITKPANSENPKIIQRKLALSECEKCPCCGSNRSHLDSQQYTYTNTHFLWKETWEVMEFTCRKCGCEFESDPYDFDSKPKGTYMMSIITGLTGVTSFVSGIVMLAIDAQVPRIVCNIAMGVGICFGILCSALNILYRNVYKKHTFYNDFTPIEKHILTTKDLESKLNVSDGILDDGDYYGDTN